jgi:hypothetical protein
VIEHRHPVGQLCRVVVRQEEPARTDTQTLGLQQRLRDEQIGRRVRLPRRGVMLTDPGLRVTEAVELAQHRQVVVVTLLQAALGRV